jgi:hypothetical protein
MMQYQSKGFGDAQRVNCFVGLFVATSECQRLIHWPELTKKTVVARD